MSKRPIYIAFTAVILLALALLSLPTRAAVQVKLALGGLFLPLFGLANTGHALLAKAGDSLVPRHVLQAELDQLRRENQALQIQAQQTAAIFQENARLRDELGWARKAPWKLKLARVVGRDPANWWRAIHIGLGKRDGVHPGMAVLTSEGLVGRTVEVGYSRTMVVLVGDPNCRVAAKIQETHETTGIIVPSASDPGDNTMVDLTFLPRTANIKPGAKVVTWGEGGVYPPGIPVGQIIDSRPVEYGLYQEARVKLAASLSRLEEVWVLWQ